MTAFAELLDKEYDLKAIGQNNTCRQEGKNQNLHTGKRPYDSHSSHTSNHKTNADHMLQQQEENRTTSLHKRHHHQLSRSNI